MRDGVPAKWKVERQKGEIGARAKARLGRRLVLPVYIAWEMSVLCLPPWAVRGIIGNGAAMHYGYGGDGGNWLDYPDWRLIGRIRELGGIDGRW